MRTNALARPELLASLILAATHIFSGQASLAASSVSPTVTDSTQSACSASTTSNQQTKSLLLFGLVEYNDQPDVEAFQLAIQADAELPCYVKLAIHRLTRVARNAEMRRTVWKRMIRQEYLMVCGHDLARIAALADACNMPVVR